jgi:hypothetical protein
MLMRLVATAVSVIFLAAATNAVMPTYPAHAETQKAEKKEKAEKKAPSPAQKAARDRMRECGAEWQEQKKEGKTKGTTWRKFSSECLKRKEKQT